MITGPQSREGSRGSDWKGPGQAKTWCRGFQSRASGTYPAASCTRCTTSPARPESVSNAQARKQHVSPKKTRPAGDQHQWVLKPHEVA